MADVFISYARPTEAAVRKLVHALESSGYSVWFDDEIPAHRAYSDVICEQLEAAKAVIVFWSAQAAASQWVRSEANRAREKGVLIQARLDGARLPMPFDQIQCVDLTRWNGDRNAPAWRRLAASVAELAGASQRPSQPHEPGFQPMPRPRLPRRSVLAGAGAVAALALLGGLVWRREAEPEVPPEARANFQHALSIMQDGRPEEQDQATAYLLEATRIAPDFAPAWGALALTYALRKYQIPFAERAGNEARCRSAARTALDLDSDDPWAEAALALLVPTYRNWSRVEEMGRRFVRRHSSVPLSQHVLGDMLCDVGRWSDAVEVYAKVNRRNFVIPLSDRSIIQALWGAGEIQRAEAMLTDAAGRWPRHRAIWNLRTNFLMHSGRPDEAIRLIENESGRPPGYPEDWLKAALATARALSGSMNPEEAVATNLATLDQGPANYLTYLNHKITTGQVVAQRAAALGDRDTALSLLDGYYFARGAWDSIAPAAGDQDRTTVPLFEPPMSGLWNDRRFGTLLEQIGLGEYWRASETVPDFRRS